MGRQNMSLLGRGKDTPDYLSVSTSKSQQSLVVKHSPPPDSEYSADDQLAHAELTATLTQLVESIKQGGSGVDDSGTAALAEHMNRLMPEKQQRAHLMLPCIQGLLSAPTTASEAATLLTAAALKCTTEAWTLCFSLHDRTGQRSLTRDDVGRLLRDLVRVHDLLREHRDATQQQDPLLSAAVRGNDDEPLSAAPRLFAPVLTVTPVADGSLSAFQTAVKSLNQHYKQLGSQSPQQFPGQLSDVLDNAFETPATLLKSMCGDAATVTLDYFVLRCLSVPAFIDLADRISALVRPDVAHGHDPLYEQTIIHRLMGARSAKVHDDCYLVSMKWWRLWCEYVDFDRHEDADAPVRVHIRGASDSNEPAIHPGPIDNRDLLVDDSQRPEDVRDLRMLGVLADNLAEDKDFVHVSLHTWRVLNRWYNGGPVIVRRLTGSQKAKRIFHIDAATSFARSTRVSDHELIVDLYPLVLRVGHLGAPAALVNCVCSSKSTVYELLKLIRGQLDLPKLELSDLWADDGHNIAAHSGPAMTLDECGIVHRQVILCGAEVKDVSTTVAAGDVEEPKPSLAPEQAETDAASAIQRKGTGLVGLLNLGNTCYMNAALQCLSNIDPLLDYLFGLGIKTLGPEDGKQSGDRSRAGSRESDEQQSIVKPLVELMRRLWTEDEGQAINPLSLRTELVRRCPDFGGVSEHDSQELLSLLLDCVHEELNVVTKKPTVTAPDSRPDISDADLAKLWWSNHLQREQSVIVALFQGQFKSQLVCSSCSTCSITFPPFLFLSVPLPHELYRTYKVKVVLLGDDEPPLDCSLRANSSGTISDILEALRKLHPRFADRDYVLADTRGNYIFNIFRKSRDISDITDERYSLTAYQVEAGMKRSVSLMEVLSLDRSMSVDHQLHSRSTLHHPSSSSSNVASPGNAATRLNIIHRRLKGEWWSYGKRATTKSTLYGVPLYAMVPHQGPKVTGTELYNYVMTRIRTTFGYVCAMSQPPGGGPLSASTATPVSSSSSSSSSNGHSAATLSVSTSPSLLAPSSSASLLSAVVPESPSTQNSKGLLWRNIKSPSSPPPDVFAGYPFSLKLVNRAGSTCARCPTSAQCTGCRLVPVDLPLPLEHNDTIAIEWSKSVKGNSGVDFGKIFARSVPFRAEAYTAAGTSSASATSSPGASPASAGHSPVHKLKKFRRRPRKTSGTAEPVDDDYLNDSVGANDLSDSGQSDTSGGASGILDDDGSASGQDAEPITLHDILQEYEKVEKLEASDFYCSKCKGPREAFKRETIFRLPPILLVHIKRFTYDHTGCVKNDKMVHVPLDVDLAPYLTPTVEQRTPFPKGTSPAPSSAIPPATAAAKAPASSVPVTRNVSTTTITSSLPPPPPAAPPVSPPLSVSVTAAPPPPPPPPPPTQYQLTAAIHHIGTSYSGHYYAATKRPTERAWRVFNDNKLFIDVAAHTVTRTDRTYVLFYCRRAVDLAKVVKEFDAEREACRNVADLVTKQLATLPSG
ncbi:hypothetical protein RI367_001398 [Sorochytrium milnesiophthora]